MMLLLQYFKLTKNLLLFVFKNHMLCLKFILMFPKFALTKGKKMFPSEENIGVGREGEGRKEERREKGGREGRKTQVDGV